MKMTLMLVLHILIQTQVFSQDHIAHSIKKMMKGDQCIADSINGDGVYIIRHKKNMKWGMIQTYSKKIEKLIPMQYDSINFFAPNGYYTDVYNNGKVGFYLSAWSYGKKAKQSVLCIYEAYKTISIQLDEYLAVMKNGRWGWVDFYTGEEKSEFIYDSTDELPKPDWECTYY